jgi:Fic-DOC domain mobile mystery protein B
VEVGLSFFRTIPGGTPIDDISGLKIKGITLRRQLNLLEAENILKATIKYLLGSPSERTAPFTYSWVLKLHREMFGKVWDWAGLIRTKPGTNIGVPPGQIEPQLFELMKSLPLWGDMALIEQAARLHHRAVQIHPFENGNGRWSRMLANIWLARHDHIPTKWPEELVGTVSPIRDRYIQAVKAGDQGEIGPLVDLHKEYTPSDEG